MNPRPEIAEAIGVFALVFAGVGAILANASSGGAVGHLGIALTFGLTILVMIYALGHVSGAHFNPAITLAFAATGHFPWRRVPTYVLAQCAGAAAASFALAALVAPVAPGVTMPAEGVGLPQAFALEAIATFFLALVIIGVATDRRAAPGAAGLAIGLTVTLDALFAGPLTGASMNPARSLGPALASGEWSGLWLYVLAPVLGAVLAMATYEYLRQGRVPAAGEPLGALGPFRLSVREAETE